MVKPIEFFLFGGIRVARDGDHPSPLKAPRAVQGLLAYLLVQRHRVHSREVLAGLFWGDHSPDQARSCLSTALWRLRPVLEPDGTPRGTYLLTTSAREIGFNQDSEHWLDVAVFEERANQALRKPAHSLDDSDVKAIENAIQLYTGDLLEGFYGDWAIHERERLHSLYLASLAHLMCHFRRRGAYEQSLKFGRRILDQDPIREEIHREMMTIHLESGQRALAVRQYEECRGVLAAELGIPPMEETRALYEQAVRGETRSEEGNKCPETKVDLRQAIMQLGVAVRALEQASEQLRCAIELAGGYAEG